MYNTKRLFDNRFFPNLRLLDWARSSEHKGMSKEKIFGSSELDLQLTLVVRLGESTLPPAATVIVKSVDKLVDAIVHIAALEVGKKGRKKRMMRSILNILIFQ